MLDLPNLFEPERSDQSLRTMEPLEAFTVTHKTLTITVVCNVTGAWLEGRFGLPEGSLLGFRLDAQHNRLEIPLSSLVPLIGVPSFLAGKQTELIIKQGVADQKYDSGWFPVQSTTGNDIFKEHNLGTFPTRYSIFFSPSISPEPSEIWDMTGSCNYCDQHGGANTAFHCGSVKFTSSTYTIPLWSGGVVGRYYSDVNKEWQTHKTGFWKVLLWS